MFDTLYNKKIIVVMLLFLSVDIFAFPFGFGYHHNVWFESVDNLYYLHEKDFDKIKKYYREGSYFLCIADHYSEISGENRKNKIVIGRFRLYVVSEFKYVDYDIKSIKVIHKDKIYDEVV